MATSTKTSADSAPPRAGITPDSSTDYHKYSGAIPKYNIVEDENSVPTYTREYLVQLSNAIDSRLPLGDDEKAHHTHFPGRSNMLRSILLYSMAIFALFWVIVVFIILVVIASRLAK